MVIFPGGGYGHLAEHEGQDYAEYLSSCGIAGFVVKYRLGTDGFHHPAMLEDAYSAIREVRSRSMEFEIAPDCVGVMGSSAGGHLAAHSLVAYEKYESDVSLRPDFGVLCYPVITSEDEFTHKGSMRNLLGENYSNNDLLASMSLETHITPQTPPCFIWHTVEDPAVPVENSMRFASSLRKAAVPFELHLYEEGRHGLGLNAKFGWEKDLLRWLNRFTEGE
jgi:acetyl esterase/lipase